MDKTQYTPLSQGDQGDDNDLENQQDESYPMSQSRTFKHDDAHAPLYRDRERDNTYHSGQSESSWSDDEDVLKHPIDPLEEDDEEYGDAVPKKQVGFCPITCVL